MTLGYHPPTVVLVDDTPEIRLLVRTALERRGDFRVVGEAGDGSEGIDVVQELQPDVVLLDIAMPVMDGLDALPRILDACPDSKVVMLSGFAADRMVERAMSAGAVGYLQKGMPVRALVSQLRGLVGAGEHTDDSGPTDTARRTMSRAALSARAAERAAGSLPRWAAPFALFVPRPRPV